MTIQIHCEAGLHARPLAQFVKMVKMYQANVQVYNLTNGRGPVNGASPMQLLLMAATKNHEIRIVSNGAQAEEVLQGLKLLIENNFGEV